MLVHAHNLHNGKVKPGEPSGIAGQAAHLASELQVQCESVSKNKLDGPQAVTAKVHLLAATQMQMNTHA